tara:strand:- start:89 stop:274 length:186 start_codon:yes stop_codon:yes gene_type:complete
MLKTAILNNLNKTNKEKLNTKIFKYSKDQFKPSTIIDMTPLSYTFTTNIINNNNKLFVIKE